jgi:hypothetical protein
VSVLVAGLLLGGCAARADLAPHTAGELQQSVLELTQAVADGRFEVAGARLADLRRELAAAADQGDVSATRYRMIDEALTLTEAQLAAAEQAAAEEAAAQEAAARQTAVDQALAEQAAAAQAAAEQAAAEKSASEKGQPKPPGQGKGGSGKGGSGKGG